MAEEQKKESKLRLAEEAAEILREYGVEARPYFTAPHNRIGRYTGELVVDAKSLLVLAGHAAPSKTKGRTNEH